MSRLALLGLIALLEFAQAGLLIAASNEHLTRDKVCTAKAYWAGDVFDQIAADPRVILSGMDAEDANAFAFIRQWVKDGKTRAALVDDTRARCLGETV